MISSFQLFSVLFIGGFAILILGAVVKFWPLIVLGIIIAPSAPVTIFLGPMSKTEQYEAYKWLPDARHVHGRQIQKKELGFELD